METLTTTGLVHVAGEVTTNGYVEIPEIVRRTILDIGYDSSANGFDGARCGVSVSIGQQSQEISDGVFNSLEVREGTAVDPRDAQGAGDQGLMFGYASDETATLMPTPIHLAHRLSERLTAVRKDGTLSLLRPDGKTQVTSRLRRGHPGLRADHRGLLAARRRAVAGGSEGRPARARGEPGAGQRPA